jgi:phosphatidylglycerol:prolipoprotein diacylglycerol transferase
MPAQFYLGPIPIRLYGIILMVGAVVAAFVAEREARRRGKNSEYVWDALIWVLIGGILGARLWHVFLPSAADVARGLTTQFYLTHPLDLLAVWHGGLGIPGAVIGGVLALYIFCRRKKLVFAEWADIAAPALALGQAIGRWGNYVNQELYGYPTNVPWAIFIEPEYRLKGHEHQAYYHPLFLYESLWNFGNFILLLVIGRRYEKKLIPGDLFLIYLVVYPLGRFFLEFLRLDPAKLGDFNPNQMFMLVVALVSAGALILRHRKKDSSLDQADTTVD